MRFFASGGIFRFGALLTVKTGLYLESFSKGQLLCRTQCARQGCTALRSVILFCKTAFLKYHKLCNNWARTTGHAEGAASGAKAGERLFGAHKPAGLAKKR